MLSRAEHESFEALLGLGCGKATAVLSQVLHPSAMVRPQTLNFTSPTGFAAEVQAAFGDDLLVVRQRLEREIEGNAFVAIRHSDVALIVDHLGREVSGLEKAVQLSAAMTELANIILNSYCSMFILFLNGPIRVHDPEIFEENSSHVAALLSNESQFPCVFCLPVFLSRMAAQTPLITGFTTRESCLPAIKQLSQWPMQRGWGD